MTTGTWPKAPGSTICTPKRLAWNAGNPGQPLPAIEDQTVPRGGSPVVNIAVSQQNVRGCGPLVVVCTPNGESGSVSVGFPSAAGDGRYGYLGWLGLRQWMTDPLWQAPAVPCAQRESTTYREDASGSCGLDPSLPRASGDMTIDYYTRPYEEALAALPSGAPALPAGLRLGCVNLGTAGAPNWVGPDCDGPAAIDFAPWAYRPIRTLINAPTPPRSTGRDERQHDNPVAIVPIRGSNL